MSNTNAATTITKEGDKPKTLFEMLQGIKGVIQTALPKHINADRMLRIGLTALRTNGDLQRCTPASFLGSIVQASQLGLEVNTPLGQAYLIPFRNKRAGTMECQLIIGYQGFMDLARRSGEVKNIYAFPVYEGDAFEFELGLDPKILHRPGKGTRDPLKLTHTYAVAKLSNGEPVFTILTREDVERYRDRSRSKDNGPWVTDYEAMAMKTAVRRLFRWLPKSAEMARAVEVDQTIETHKSQLSAVDPQILGLLESQGVDVSEASQESSDEPPPAPAEPSQDGKRISLGKKGVEAKTADVAQREPGED